MKPTRRRNGTHMVTITPTPQDLDAEDVARIIAAERSSYAIAGDSLSRKEIERIVRSGLTENGRGHYYYVHEKREPAEWDNGFTWAAEQIRRHWPDWAAEIPMSAFATKKADS